MPIQIQYLIRAGRQAGAWANLFDKAIPNEKPPIWQFGVLVIHRDNISMFDKQSGHGFSLFEKSEVV